MSAVVFDIQRFSTHDGPGIRTTVFFKGCPLRCFWCHNPESMLTRPELMRRSDKCIGCGECIRACPEEAFCLDEQGVVFIHEKCVGCGGCALICPSKALVISGRDMDADEIMSEIRKDILFYRKSGGGVTFSGGEPLLRAEMLTTLLKACREEGIGTAVDTSGDVDYSAFELTMPYADLYLYDVKSAVDETHIRGTGRTNAVILENLGKLVRHGAKVIVRVPVIPGFNDNAAEMEAIARLLEGMPELIAAELLAFHRMGSAKYEYLDRQYAAAALIPPEPETMYTLAEILRGSCREIRV